MAKYRLEVYGWEMEAIGHSITDEQVDQIVDLMDENEYDELWECRNNGDLEEEGIIPDIYNPDLFHVSRGLDNGTTFYVVKDENDETVVEFDHKDLGDPYDLLGDDDVIEKNYPYEGYLCIPEMMEGVDNILFIADENKGGIASFEFESDEVPTAKDFCILNGDIGTPDGDWDFISKYFFRGQLLEYWDGLDNRGKSSTVEIYRKDGTIIN